MADSARAPAAQPPPKPHKPQTAGAHARRHTRAPSGRAHATDRRSTTRSTAGHYPAATIRARVANGVPPRVPPASARRTRADPDPTRRRILPASCPHRPRRRAKGAPPRALAGGAPAKSRGGGQDPPVTKKHPGQQRPAIVSRFVTLLQK